MISFIDAIDMTKSERIKHLIDENTIQKGNHPGRRSDPDRHPSVKKLLENTIQKERIKLLEKTIKEFHQKMNALLTFCKIQNKQTENEILQSKFNNTYQDEDL